MAKDIEHLGPTRADQAWTYGLLGGGGALVLLLAPLLARWLDASRGRVREAFLTHGYPYESQ